MRNVSQNIKRQSLKAVSQVALFCSLAITNVTLAQVVEGQYDEDNRILGERPVGAQATPLSILFPSGTSRPYFPEHDEIGISNENNRAINDLNDGEIISDGDLNPLEMGSQSDQLQFGTISWQQGGYSPDLWLRSEISDLNVLFRALTLPKSSPAMTEISRKLLLSVASAPIGLSEDDELEINEIDVDEELVRRFTNLRLTELIERGNLSEIMSFLMLLPEGYLQRNKQNAEMLLLIGDFNGACQLSKQNSYNRFAVSDALFWQKINVFCSVMEGDNSGAQVALDMLNDRGSRDFIFFDLIGLLMEEPERREFFRSAGVTSLDPLNYTILSLLDQPIDADLSENSSAMVLSALVINPNIAVEDRLKAAVKSYELGGVSVETLRNIFALQEYTATEISNAVRFTANDDSTASNVLLYQAALRQVDNFEKANIIEAMWNKASTVDDLPKIAKLNINALGSVRPGPDMIVHAHHVTRGLLLGGDIDQALQWFEYVRRMAVSGDQEATTALLKIWPLMVIADETEAVPWDDEILNLWFSAQMDLMPEERDAKAALFYAISEAFGREVPSANWMTLVNGSQSDGVFALLPGVGRELDKAITAKQFGQAVLLSLIAVGENSPGVIDSSGLSAIIRAFKSFNLNDDARNIALEAMAANGF